MNKKGYLLLTERIISKDFQPYKRWLMFGSILPDLLYHTYLTGHTWESAFEKIVRKMESFESWGGMSGFSCMYLGYLLHYVEDFFTFPHNSGFRGRLAEHIQYEKQFTQYLLGDNGQPALNTENLASTDDLKDQLCRLHGNPLLRDRLSMGALHTAKGRSWDSVMAELMRSYSRVLQDDMQSHAV